MKNYALILLFLLGLAFPSRAQRLLEKEFQVLNMNDGIADNDIHSIEKDTEGFIWFGTSSGLSRYDGQDFKTFRIKEAPHRTAGQVVSLNKDYLLVRSERTLFLFDKQRERFLSLSGMWTGIKLWTLPVSWRPATDIAGEWLGTRFRR